MQISITSLNLKLTKQNLTNIREKAQRIFEKLDMNIHSVKITIDDLNGPKGGKDKHCQIIIRINGLPDVVITDNQTSAISAVNIALSRAKNTLIRKVKRSQSLAA